MRPIEKWAVGHTLPDGTFVATNYNPHTQANRLLHENLDDFCNYCEVFSDDLEVEHINAQSENPQLRTAWENFVLACGRCNGSDNKGVKPVDYAQMYYPHLNNTLLVFEYGEGGLVKINPNLSTQSQQNKATELLDLVCLDKYPRNPKYPATVKYEQGFPHADTRWSHRSTAWEDAIRKLAKYEAHEINSESVARFAHQRGYFSVWFTVFKAHRDVKAALVHIFKGTATNCFDADFNPIPRNLGDLVDPI
jgi:uncharacterized protein (TIGR02646 family)